jgi:IPTL-CTERM motif
MKSLMNLRLIATMALCVLIGALGLNGAARTAIPASERAVLVALYNATNGAAWTNTVANNRVWTVAAAPGNECTWFGVVCTVGEANIDEVSLSVNNLVGTLPATFNQLTLIRNFDVSDNQLTGSIPVLTGLTTLRGFAVRRNQLTGSLPAFTGLSNLRFFDAGRNQLTGTIPAFTGLTNLQEFWVDSNQLTGSIPALSSTLRLILLRVNNNQLTGGVPAITSSLSPGDSRLCPNQLTPSVSEGWNLATGSTPWSALCGSALQAQTLSFGAPPILVAGGSGVVSATSNPSPGSSAAIVFTSLTPLVCRVDVNTGAVTASALAVPGSVCTITADKAGDAAFTAAATAQQSFLIIAAPVVAATVAVPTLGQWSVMFLSLLAAMLGAIRLQQTRRVIVHVSAASHLAKN